MKVWAMNLYFGSLNQLESVLKFRDDILTGGVILSRFGLSDRVIRRTLVEVSLQVVVGNKAFRKQGEAKVGEEKDSGEGTEA